MAENKTKPTGAEVKSYFAAIKDEARRADCEELARIMTRATKEQPKMWGTSIVGFGSYHYKYESGREGDSCLVGFASRKSDIAIYGLGSFAAQKPGLVSQLGKCKIGKGCLSIRKLSQTNREILERLVAGAMVARKKYR
jgi:hypothetical protein